MKTAALLSAALAVASASTANAAVLVINGGFETGDFTGWSVAPPDLNNTFIHNVPVVVHSGSYAALMADDAEYDYLSQNVSTVPGHNYQIDYWLKSNNSGDFYASWNGSPIAGSAINFTQDYTFFSFQLPATAATTTLEFAGINHLFYFAVDDVSVIDLDAVPEPASLSLLALGAVALLRRRRG